MGYFPFVEQHRKYPQFEFVIPKVAASVVLEVIKNQHHPISLNHLVYPMSLLEVNMIYF